MSFIISKDSYRVPGSWYLKRGTVVYRVRVPCTVPCHVRSAVEATVCVRCVCVCCRPIEYSNH